MTSSGHHDSAHTCDGEMVNQIWHSSSQNLITTPTQARDNAPAQHGCRWRPHAYHPSPIARIHRTRNGRRNPSPDVRSSRVRLQRGALASAGKVAAAANARYKMIGAKSASHDAQAVAAAHLPPFQRRHRRLQAYARGTHSQQQRMQGRRLSGMCFATRCARATKLAPQLARCALRRLLLGPLVLGSPVRRPALARSG